MNLSRNKPRNFTETSKAHARRERDGFFRKYIHGKGIDIGHNGDPLTPDCDMWDIEDGDAQYMAGVPFESYDFVYSSHLLEHVEDADDSLIAWWDLVKHGGYLILFLPHRDLYEKRKELPSRWNPDHKRFFMPIADEPPCTVGAAQLIANTLTDYELIKIEICDEGHTITNPNIHSDGEYSIEIILRKK